MVDEPNAGATNARTDLDESDSDKPDAGAGGWNEMERVNARIPKAVADAVDEAVENDYYGSRSDAIRSALREKFLEPFTDGGVTEERICDFCGLERATVEEAIECCSEVIGDDEQVATDGAGEIDLTLFQLRILAILSEQARYGLAVKRELEEIYGDVNHGRLYPNLDELVERGLVEKSQRDNRTNEYARTAYGRDVLGAELTWLAARYQAEADPTLVTDGGQPATERGETADELEAYAADRLNEAAAQLRRDDLDVDDRVDNAVDLVGDAIEAIGDVTTLRIQEVDRP